MTIIVEDGSEVTDANSYASYAELVAYGALRGTPADTIAEGGETLLIKAMDRLYGMNWKGERVSSTQSLEWPRYGAYLDGQLLPSDEIPRELIYGQLSLAIAAIDTTLQPVQPATLGKGAVIEERVEGAVTIKYANPGTVPPVAAIVPDAFRLLNGLIRNAGLRVIRA
jgi:hypothetical protein